MENENKPIRIQLPNGMFLTAEQSMDTEYPEIMIGLTDADGIWIQDLAIVGAGYHYEKGKEHPVIDNGRYTVAVFENEEAENYTKKFHIPQVPDKYLQKGHRHDS